MARAGTGRPARGAELELVRRLEELVGQLREAVEGVRGRRRRQRGLRPDLEALREDYAAAASSQEDRAALLSEMHREAARDAAARPADPLPDLAAPCFAHMRLAPGDGGPRRDVLLGPCALPGLGRGAALVDWRTAPLAEVFFTCRAGEEYEVEVDGRTLEGLVEERHVLTFEDGRLAAITVDGGTLRRRGEAWWLEPVAAVPPLAGAPGTPLAAQLVGSVVARPRGAAPVTALLDRAQHELLRRDPREPLLVLGGAGCGKTTVALHRLATISARDPERYPPSRLLVVVPERGLRRLSERLLAELDLGEVRVATFDEWVREQARRLFSPWLPARVSPDRPALVSRVKRHPALLAAMDRLVAERAAAGSSRAAPSSLRDDHLRLVGDRALLAEAVRASAGELPWSSVEVMASHLGRQLDEPAEVRYAHVDPSRLETLDGRPIDEGTPDEVAGTVDPEDYALLLELLFRRTGKTATRSGRLDRYAHVVVDEAQELAPVELRVLGRAVDRKRGGGSVTVAGDAAQRIDRTGYFGGWEAVMEALGAPGAASARLETSYRCPAPIVELGLAVLGPELAPEPPPRPSRQGAPVSRSSVPTEGHAAARIAAVLSELSSREPEASVAVVARDARSARGIHEVICHALRARLVLDGEFAFRPGVEVTEAAAVKGLEFDYVVLPDATARAYPDTPEARRLLHVAVTRAAHQLWIVSPGPPSPVLP